MSEEAGCVLSKGGVRLVNATRWVDAHIALPWKMLSMGIINIEAMILKVLLENKVSIPLDQNASESSTSQKLLVLGL